MENFILALLVVLSMLVIFLGYYLGDILLVVSCGFIGIIAAIVLVVDHVTEILLRGSK